MIVDIRDGIYYESLYSGIEKIRFKRKLIDYEKQLELADILSFNLTGLRDYYTSKLSRPGYVIYNFNLNIESVRSYPREGKKVSILYAGGLMRSSIGQNIFEVVKAIRQFNTNHIQLTLIGRFNVVEKMIYRLLLKSIIIKKQVSENELLNLLKSFDLLLMVNTTNRDLLPSKFWVYLLTDIPILSVGASHSLLTVSEDVPGFYDVKNDKCYIYDFLKKYNFVRASREHLKIPDDMDNLKKIINE